MNVERKYPVDSVFNLTVVTDGDDNEAREIQRCCCPSCNLSYRSDFITVGGDSSAGVDFVLDYIKTHQLNVRLTHVVTRSRIHLLIH